MSIARRSSSPKLLPLPPTIRRGRRVWPLPKGLKRQEAGLLDELIVRYQHRLLRYLLYLTGNREHGRGPVSGGLDAGAGARRPVQRPGAL